MTIELLGDNCRRCRLLHRHIEMALQGFAPGADLFYVDDPERFAHYGLMSLPALAVDGKIKMQGEVLSSEKLLAILVNS